MMDIGDSPCESPHCINQKRVYMVKRLHLYIDSYGYTSTDLNEVIFCPKDSNDVILNEYSWGKSARKLWKILMKLANKE